MKKPNKKRTNPGRKEQTPATCMITHCVFSVTLLGGLMKADVQAGHASRRYRVDCILVLTGHTLTGSLCFVVSHEGSHEATTTEWAQK